MKHYFYVKIYEKTAPRSREIKTFHSCRDFTQRNASPSRHTALSNISKIVHAQIDRELRFWVVYETIF